jgi:hypothetical protein
MQSVNPEKINFSFSGTAPFCSEIIENIEKNNKIYFVSNSRLIANKTFMPMKEIFSIDLIEKKMEVEAVMKYERNRCGVCLLGNYIYILGGVISTARIRTNLCERYDITTKTVEKIPKMTQIRLCPAVTVFKVNSKELIYVFGGLKDSETIDFSIEIFDPIEMSWKREKVMNNYIYISRHQHLALQINSEEILLFGGVSERNKPNRKQNVQVLQAKNIFTNKKLNN